MAELGELQHEVRTAEAEARPKPPAELDQGAIIARMAETISEFRTENITSEELIGKLLALKGPAGRKLVFTRVDLFQIFAIWAKKLAGEEQVDG